MPPRFNTPADLPQTDTDRLNRYAENLRFYEGDQWEIPRNTLQRTRTQHRRLTFNLTQTIIDKAANYLVQDMRFVADPVDDTADALRRADETETLLQQLVDQNALDQLDFDNELDCSVLGDAAYKVTWDAGAGRLRVTAPDVTGLFAWYRPDDPSELWRVCHRYEIPAAQLMDLYGLASTNTKAKIIEEWYADRFLIWVDSQLAVDDANPYRFIPYVIYPNIRRPKQQWGDSDVRAIRDAQREYNRITTQLSLITELSGNPITVLEGVTESTDIGVQPGAVWELPDGAKAYLLDLLARGGVKVLETFRDAVRQDMHDLAEIPPTAFGRNERALSGVALNVALDPLVKKIRRKRLLRGRALTTRNAMMLAILAQQQQIDPAIATHPHRVQWGALLPNDRTRDVADEVALVGAGIHSRRRAAGELGVTDPDAEFAQWLDENERLVENQPTHTPTPQRTTNA